MRRRALAREPVGEAAVPPPLHARSTSRGRSSRSSSRSASRSTRAGRARPRRAGRSAGTGATPTSPSGTTRPAHGALSRASRLAAIAVALTVPLGVALAIGAHALARPRRRRRRAASRSLTARDARDRHGRRAPPRLRQPSDVHPARDDRRRRSGTSRSRSSFVAHHRARAPALDRAGVRGGRARPRRVAAPGAAARAPARCSCPAIVASAIIVFAISMDDFVVSAFLSSGSTTDTVPVRIYSPAARRRRRR